MAKLADKLENALNDSRILILGVQVLIGFDYRAALEDNFPQLPPVLQLLKVVSLTVQLVAFALLVSPVPFHHIVAERRATLRLHRFTHKVTELALLPLAFSLALDVHVAGFLIYPSAAITLGAVTFLLALFYWYGYLYLRRRRAPHAHQHGSQEDHDVELKDKVKEVLIEARMVLPGAQALLGFQFITVLMKRFTELPAEVRMVHLASLFAIAVSVVLLVSPAAFHRIVNEGEDSEQLVRYGSHMVLASLVPLSFGLCGDFYVVLRAIGFAVGSSAGASIALNVAMLGFWFAWMVWRREEGRA